MEIFDGKECEVTRLTYRGNHGILSFMIAPDGCFVGQRSDRSIEARDRYLQWLQEESELVDHVVVTYEAQHPTAAAVRESSDDFSPRDRQTMIVIGRVLEHLHGFDEGFSVEAIIDRDIGADLEFDAADYVTVLRELEARLPIKFPDALTNPAEFGVRPPFNTPRDLLRLTQQAQGDRPTRPDRLQRRKR